MADALTLPIEDARDAARVVTALSSISTALGEVERKAWQVLKGV